MTKEEAREKIAGAIWGVNTANAYRCADVVMEALAPMFDEVTRLRVEVAEWQARDWEDIKDEWSDAIKAAHPVRSGSHDEYGIAMQMVGHRHSKGELVALVNWLLVERGKLQRR